MGHVPGCRVAGQRVRRAGLRGVATESDLTAVRFILVRRRVPPTTTRRRACVPGCLPAGSREWSESLAHAAPGSDHQLALARSFAAAAEDAQLPNGSHDWLQGRATSRKAWRSIPSCVGRSVANLARLGRWGDDRHLCRTGTGCRRSPEPNRPPAPGPHSPTAAAKANAWRLAVEEDAIPNGTQSAICLGFWQRGQDELLSSVHCRATSRPQRRSPRRRASGQLGAFRMRNNVVALAVSLAGGEATVPSRVDCLARTDRVDRLGAADRRGTARRSGSCLALPGGGRLWHDVTSLGAESASGLRAASRWWAM